MPRGIYKRKPATVAATVIDIPTRSGFRGRLDRLLAEYTMKAQALRITTDILDEDDRKLALETAPKKFLQAMNHRATNGQVHDDDGEREVAAIPIKKSKKKRIKKSAAVRQSEVRAFLLTHPGAFTKEIGEAIGVNPGTVRHFARVVAKPLHKVKPRQPVQWVLRGQPKDAPQVN